MELFGRHIQKGAYVLVDGKRVRGKVKCMAGGKLPNCNDERVKIRVKRVTEPGMRLLQVANKSGLLSNEFLVFVD